MEHSTKLNVFHIVKTMYALPNKIQDSIIIYNSSNEIVDEIYVKDGILECNNRKLTKLIIPNKCTTVYCFQ